MKTFTIKVVSYIDTYGTTKRQTLEVDGKILHDMYNLDGAESIRARDILTPSCVAMSIQKALQVYTAGGFSHAQILFENSKEED